MYLTHKADSKSEHPQEIPCETVRILDWDSTFFGFRVSEILPACSLIHLPQAISEAVSHGSRVIYWKPSSLQLSGPKWLVNSHVQDQVIFLKDLTQVASPRLHGFVCLDFTISRLTGNTASDDVFGLAVQAGWNSRFQVDPRFGDKPFRRLYRQWIDQSCSNVASDAVFVIRNEAGLSAAMVSLTVTGNECRIGLLAVNPKFRRQGLGRLLMQQSEQFAMSRGCDRLIVTTQTNNLAAIELYEHAGFHEDSRVSIFHFWIDSLVSIYDS